MISRKQKYAQFCQDENIPIFLTPEWMDAVAPEKTWDVVLAEDSNGEIQGSFVFNMVKKYRLTFITHPPLTPYQGLWLKPLPAMKESSAFSRKNRIISSLIEQLPHFHYLHLRMHHNMTDHLAFQWAGYSTRIGTSFVLPDISDPEKLFKEFRGSTRTDVRKFENMEIEACNDLEIIFDLTRKTLKGKGIHAPYSVEFLERIDHLLIGRSRRDYFVLRDSDRNVLASVYIVYDSTSAYYLLGSRSSVIDSGGSLAMLIWHSIKAASSRCKTFDFEGSRIREISRYFSSFGALPVSCTEIFSIPNRMLKILFLLSGRG